MALAYYELEEGESPSFGYHAHGDQEEVFYSSVWKAVLTDEGTSPSGVCHRFQTLLHVQQGAVTFRTESETVTATAGEVVRSPPGELQRAVNERAERAVTLVVGAPREAGELTLLRFWEACDDETPRELRDVDSGRVRETVCADCGGVTGRFTR